MKRVFIFSICCLLSLGLFSCSNNSSEVSPTTSAAKKSPTKKAKKSRTTSLVSCELLTTEMVMAEFNVTQDQIIQEPYGDKMCSYRWEKANAEEIDERNGAIMKEHMNKQLKASMEGKTLKVPKMEETNIYVGLTVVDMKEPSRASAAFDNMIKTISEGISAEKDGVKAKFRVVYDQQIDGVGDQAAWSSKSSQLSFRTGSVFLHVQAELGTDSEANLAQAKVLAKKILAKF